MRVWIKVKPNSKVDRLGYDEQGQLVVKLKAAPVDGKANRYMLRYLAEVLDVPFSRIRLVAGFNTARKKLEIDAEEAEIQRRLEAFRYDCLPKASDSG